MRHEATLVLELRAHLYWRADRLAARIRSSDSVAVEAFGPEPVGTLAHYEVGTARMPVSIVPAFARLYGVVARVVMQMLDGVLAQASR